MGCYSRDMLVVKCPSISFLGLFFVHGSGTSLILFMGVFKNLLDETPKYDIMEKSGADLHSHLIIHFKLFRVITRLKESVSKPQRLFIV